jgi:beta-glucosidase
VRLTSKLLSCIAVLMVSTHSFAQEATYPFQKTSLPIQQRVDDLVGRLTLQEKVSQTTMTAAAIPRLGIPEYTWWNEALHGLARSGPATVFPQAIGLGATWDPVLMHQVGDVISTEARARYDDAIAHNNRSIFFGLTLWSPNINIFRDPRWGRGQETYGEDPYLTSRLGVAFVEGIQGDDSRYLKAIATPKHYAIHSGPEPLRHEFNVNPSPQDLEATYLPAFRATITEAKAASIMCAYNAVEGTPACANPMLLQKILRDEWGFSGFVTSDCFAVTNIWKSHHYAPDEEHAAAVSLKAGTDTSCGEEYSSLTAAVQDKLVSEAELDTAVKRLFEARFRLGMFDPPGDIPFNKLPLSEIDSIAHRSTALKVSRESIVLLKNANGMLPLTSTMKSIAVVGPNAVELAALEGNYNGQPSHPVLPLDGIVSKFGAHAKVSYAEGSEHVDGLAVTVPRTVFRDGADATGLKAEYFNNLTMQGAPGATRIDHEISFDWNASPPAPGIDPNAFSVRWTGILTPPAPGDYVFKTIQPRCFHNCETEERYRIFIDGKIYIDGGMNRHKALGGETLGAGGTFKMHFDDTSAHHIRFEYSHKSALFGAGLVFQWEPPAGVLQNEAVDAAKKSDVVIACVGLTPRLEGEEFPLALDGFAGGDRTKIELPKVQEDLLKALAETGKPLVVVLQNGSTLAIPWAKANAAAIIEAWYPGQAGGEAIADVLSGDYNPAGRMPVTMYESTGQLPPFEEYSMANRTYRYFSGKPLYGFGFGLSYTNFAYSDLKVSSNSVNAGQPLKVDVKVTNTGKRGGEEVAQVYIEGSKLEGAPIRRLAAFQRFYIAAGASRSVEFTLDSRQLSDVDKTGVRAVRPDTYQLFVGGGQSGEATGVHGTYKVSGEVDLKQ